MRPQSPSVLANREILDRAFSREAIIDRYYQERGLTRNVGSTLHTNKVGLADSIKDKASLEQYDNTFKGISSDAHTIVHDDNLTDQSKSEALVDKATSALRETETLNGSMDPSYPPCQRFIGNVTQDLGRAVSEARTGNTDGVESHFQEVIQRISDLAVVLAEDIEHFIPFV